MVLREQVALITGASSGIGRATAEAMAKQGARVAVNYLKNREGAEQAVEAIRKGGGEAVVLCADVTSSAEVQAMVAAVREQWGRIDILVNNAGASPAMGSVLECEERLWETIMNLNLKGLYFTSQAVARIMKEQGGGKIVNVASVDGFKPEPGVSIYSISKAGVRMVTKAFAMELAPFNIQVNTIAPGPISTKMMDSHWFHLPPEEAQRSKEAVARAMPMGRIGDTDDIAGAAIYLASDASNYTTGAEILIDGGVLLGSVALGGQG